MSSLQLSSDMRVSWSPGANGPRPHMRAYTTHPPCPCMHHHPARAYARNEPLKLQARQSTSRIRGGRPRPAPELPPELGRPSLRRASCLLASSSSSILDHLEKIPHLVEVLSHKALQEISPKRTTGSRLTGTMG